MRNCTHGFNPVDGPGLWCPACAQDQPGRVRTLAADLALIISQKLQRASDWFDRIFRWLDKWEEE